jgi:formate dehydrogenase accessory protein FdhD
VLVNGKELATLQRTPDRLEYLAVGFLLSDGLIKKDTEIKGIALNEKVWYIIIGVWVVILDGHKLVANLVLSGRYQVTAENSETTKQLNQRFTN